MKDKVIFIFCFIFQLGLFGQCSINVPQNACVDDAVQFSVNTNKVVTSYQWKFGDGHSSTDAKPTHIYFRNGSMKVSVNLVFSDGSRCSSIGFINLWNSPTANFSYSAGDSCQYNTVYVNDNSTTPTSQQRIIKHNVYWSDGSYDYSLKDRRGERIAHKYRVNGKFNLRVEVIDNYGCKSESILPIVIKESFQSIIKQSREENCKSIKTCFKNETTYSGSSKFEWTVNGTVSPSRTKNLCFNDFSDKLYSIKLTSSHKNGCKNSVWDTARIVIDTARPKLLLSAGQYCHNVDASLFPSASISAGKQGTNSSYSWTVANRIGGDARINSMGFAHKNERLAPGKYEVRCKINRLGCSYNLKENFRVNGPVAGMGIYKRRVCAPATVILIDSSKYSDSSSYERYWTITDPDGDKCVNWYKKNQNRGTSNCNKGRDFWLRHNFYKKGYYDVKIVALDTTTGCRDSFMSVINTKVCTPRDGICGGDGCFPICQGDYFLELSDESDVPSHFSVDGINYHKFPQNLPKSIKPGRYPLWFVFPPDHIYDVVPHGIDSFRVIYNSDLGLDTVKSKADLCVNPNPDFEIELSQRCDSWEYRVYPSDSFIRAGSDITISWDGSRTNIQKLIISNDTIIPFIKHVYKSKPKGEITVNYEGAAGCKREVEKEITDEIKYSIEHDGAVCHGKSLFAKVVGNDSISKSYINYTRPRYNWILDSIRVFEDTQTFFSMLKDPGIHTLIAEYRNLRGCTDTIQTAVIAQDLKVETSSENKYVNCSRFTQFRDSSILKYHGGKDKLTEFYWDMGDGKGRSILQDPYHVYDRPGVYTITHAVKSRSGCADTTSYIMKISNLQLSVSAKDTIGCTPVTPTFFNASKNGIGYVWYYGDTSYNTQKVKATDKSTQTYAPAGTYYARLYGYDSFYNHQNNEIYYCTEKSRKVMIVAKPFSQTLISGPDSVCVGQKVTYVSGSSNDYDKDHWYIDNKLLRTQNAPGILSHIWNSTGTFELRLAPSSSLNGICSMADTMEVVVMGIKAGFTTAIDRTNTNLYKFTNTSSSTYGSFWEILDDKSNRVATGGKKDYSYDFIHKVGEYQICLTAKNSVGCTDKVCTKVKVNGQQQLMMANVFTPGNGDGKNDDYDIVIDGESSYHLCIYNRWNELVFEQTEDNDAENWNGRVMNKGAYVPDGSYYYIFKYSFNSNASEEKVVRGSIRVIY